MSRKLVRCAWPGEDPLYCAYHDKEWGVPEWNERALYEKLVLDGFQAGLSWITILRKREAFRKAFAGFQPERVASFGARDVARLLKDEGIVRHRGKIEGAIKNAQSYLAMKERGENFAEFLWSHVGGAMRVNRHRRMGDVPAETKESQALSKALKAQGFSFCGPTIVYAFMQATGMVNDHVVTCFRHKECEALAEK